MVPHAISHAPPSPATGWRGIWIGPLGLRAGWSFLLYAGLYLAAGGGATYLLQTLFYQTLPVGWTPAVLIPAEAVSLLGGLVALAVLARIEGRSFATYGLPLRPRFGRFGEGSLWGIAAAAATLGAIAAAGGYSVAGLAVHGRALLVNALLWGLAFLLVGLSEEILFRSFPLFTLARGLGFWPAAVLFSAFFGGLHYLTKPDETWVDGFSVALLGLFLCCTVRRTGNIWFAAGFHFAFNFVSLGIAGSPNTGNAGHPIPGHLLASSFHGPAWLTGGPMGAEASVFIFPVIAGLLLGLRHRFPAVRLNGWLS